MPEEPIVNLAIKVIAVICVLLIVAYVISRTRFFAAILDKKLNLRNQAVLILVFGAISIFGTLLAPANVEGAYVHVGHLGAMIAGLLGGPAVGLGAGLIGGISRYFVGGFTAIPDGLIFVVAGLVGGVIYKLRKGEFPSIYGAVLFAIFIESLFLGLVLLIARPFDEALYFVEQAYLPLVVGNSIGMAIFALFLSNLTKERKTEYELERKVHELDALYRLQLQLSSSIDMDTALDICTRTTREVLGSKAAILMLRDGEQDKLLVRSIAEDNPTKEAEVSLGEGVAGWVAQNGEPLLVNDLDGDERFRDFKEISFKPKSVLCVPLLAKEKVIGVLEICNDATGAEFSAADERLVSSIAVNAVTTIENIRLNREILEKERRINEMEIANLREYSHELENKVQMLEIQIDEGKTKRVVSDITETEYFERLREQAKKIREGRG